MSRFVVSSFPSWAWVSTNVPDRQCRDVFVEKTWNWCGKSCQFNDWSWFSVYKTVHCSDMQSQIFHKRILTFRFRFCTSMSEYSVFRIVSSFHTRVLTFTLRFPHSPGLTFYLKISTRPFLMLRFPQHDLASLVLLSFFCQCWCQSDLGCLRSYVAYTVFLIYHVEFILKFIGQ